MREVTERAKKARRARELALCHWGGFGECEVGKGGTGGTGGGRGGPK